MADIPMPGDVGVKYVAPPSNLVPSITNAIENAFKSAGDADLALVAVADRKGGWNAALVTKAGTEDGKAGGVKVLTWIGKDWGAADHLDYGASLVWAKKF